MKKVIKMTTILIMFICTSIVFTSCSTEEKDGPEAELSFVGNLYIHPWLRLLTECELPNEHR